MEIDSKYVPEIYESGQTKTLSNTLNFKIFAILLSTGQEDSSEFLAIWRLSINHLTSLTIVLHRQGSGGESDTATQLPKQIKGQLRTLK